MGLQSGDVKQRLQSLDGLRGVMCIGIALYHFVPYYFTKGDAPYDISRYFACFTDIFFVFGGFFSANLIEKEKLSVGAYREFLVKKLARLYPLHLVTLTFYAALALGVLLGVVHPKNPDRYDPAALLPHLTLTHSLGFGNFATFNYPSWAVSAIFGCCVLLPLARVARRGRYTDALLASLWIGTLLIAISISSKYGETVTSVQEASLGIVRCAPSFLFGVLLSRNRSMKVPRFVAIVALLLSLYLLFGRGNPIAGVERLLLVCLFVSSIVALDVAGIYTPLRFKPVRTLAKYSFGIYLIHSIIANVLFQVLSPKITGGSNIRFGDVHMLGAIGFLVAGLVITLVAAVISLRTIEPYGERLMLRTLSRRSVSEPAI